jgi:iron complex transport system ATP-binding protein
VKITIENLSVRYGRHVALSDVTLSAGPGEVLGVIGPNGSGKSSLVKAIAGVAPCSGTLLFDGRPERPRAVGYMPQDNGARTALTVLEAVLLGRLGQLGLHVSATDLDAAENVLQDVGMIQHARRDLATLSGGQRQLVFLAQALVAHPPMLLLDEPLSALDIRHQLEVMELVTRLTHKRGLTTIIVLHDLTMAARATNRLAVLHGGKLLAAGATRTTMTSATIERAFQVASDVTVSDSGQIEIGAYHLLR